MPSSEIDDPRRIKGIVVERIRDGLGRHGMTMGDQSVQVDWDGRGATAKRPAIGYEYKPGPANGSDGVATTFRTARIPAIERKADRFAETTAALRRRERVIEGHRVDQADPAWSVLVDPMSAHLLAELGLTPEQIMRPKRSASSMFTTGAYGFRVAGGVEKGAIGDWKTTELHVTLHAAVLRIERIRLTRPDGLCRIEYSGGPRPHLGVTAPGGLPDTLIQAMRGRAIADIVDAAPLSGGAIAATSAKLVDGRLQFGLARRLEPYQPAPDGMDVDWLDDMKRLA